MKSVKTMPEKKSQRTQLTYFYALFCALLAMTFVAVLLSAPPRAYAAGEDKPTVVDMHVGSDAAKTDVMKQVATLDVNMNKGTSIQFDVQDNYNSVSGDRKRRQLVLEDSAGKQTKVCETSSNSVELKSEQMVVDQKLKLITLTKGDKDNDFVKRYEQQLNVRFINAKAAETKPGNADTGTVAGISKDGSSWSFSNGLQYTFDKTGFSFLDGTTMNLGALRLPLKYNHQTDGTTIVGINCSPEDRDFYNAIKNGNVWQKFTGEQVAKKTSEMDKGWSGKKFGTWGSKAFDWTVCGYMEYNTNSPNTPRALNLIVSMGMSASGHAQYLCFTGSLTFTIGGKASIVGKLTPAFWNTLKGKVGAYAGLELYIGVGLQYVASVGAYGKGQINIDFLLFPDFYLDNVKLSGELGAKAKVFGFTVYTWKILEGEKSLYNHDSKQTTSKLQAQSEGDEAIAPFAVDAGVSYPPDSRDYLNNDDALVPQEASSSASILKGIYGETELSCVTTNDGPVIAYIADAAQVGDSSRNAANRSALVYSRYKDGAWTAPKIIDTTEKSGKFADYSPTISTDGETCYIAWLAADSTISDNSSIGDLGKKLDVNVATVTNDDQITIETVCEESDEEGTMPASPKVVKVGDDLYVGWYTNETTGQDGEVVGVSGSHKIRLYKKSSSVQGVSAQSAGDETEPAAQSASEEAATQDSTPEAENDGSQSTSTEAATQSAEGEGDTQNTSAESTAQSGDASASTQSSSSTTDETQDSSTQLSAQVDDSANANSQDSNAEEAVSASADAQSSDAQSTDLVTSAQAIDGEASAEAGAQSNAEGAITEGDAEQSSATEAVDALSSEAMQSEDLAVTTAEAAVAGWEKVSEVASDQTGAITSFDVGSYGGTAACVWSLDEDFSSSASEVTLNGVDTVASSTVYFLRPNSTQAEIVAMRATNAQFAKNQDADVLTYAIRINENDGITNPYLSVQSSAAPGDAGAVVLDGSQVDLPTPYYEITGDFGKNRAGNISFLKAGDGTCDIQALVTTGAGNTDWTSIVEATADTDAVHDYCSTYVDGKPLFIFTTKPETASVDEELSAQAEDDGAVDLNHTTDESLKHLSVTDVDYDEYAVDTGQIMPITVGFENDGLLDVSGVDLWMLEDGNATKVASNEESVAIDEEGSISFDYTVPAKEEFTKAREFTVYVAPAGATVTADKIAREAANDSAKLVSFGAASLSLEADHKVVDGQESIVATVTNDGIVPQGAKLVFLNTDTDEELQVVDVPELSENATFSNTLNAANGYFQNNGIKNVTITLRDDGSVGDSYEINNTEFVATWTPTPSTGKADSNSSSSTASTTTTAASRTTTKVPNTADQTTSALAIALVAIAAVVGSVAIRATGKADEC